VSQHGSEQISVLSMSPRTGELTRVQDVAVKGKVMPLAVSPDRRFMYAALRSKPNWSISSFAIDGQTGELTQIGNTAAFNSTVYLSTDRTGRFLIAANNPNNYDHRTGALCISAIGDHGCVQAPYEMVRTPPKLHSAGVDPSNRFIFGMSCDGDAVLRYAFDATTGILNPDPLPPVLVERRRGPRHFQFHPNNRFMYMVTEYDASVYAFRYDVRNGALTEIQIIGAPPPGFEPQERGRLGISAAGADLHFTPDGRWLYVSVRASLTMAVFAVDPVTGLLTSAGHFPVPKEPRGFSIDPLGRYLFVAGDESKNLVSFAIDPATGALSKLAEYPMGEGPNWVECVRLP
jgi:6-phosphogluconolactonase